MKRFLTIAYWVAFVVCPLFAQTGFVAGRLADGDGNPVAYANIVLKTATGDSLIGSATTGEDGSFSIAADEGTYYLTATFVGYERLVVRCNPGDLGTLTMNAKQLEAVTVTAARTTEEVDRFVVLPKKEEVEAAGHTLVLLDMLKLPGLRVNVALQQITVDGGIAILQINGKEVPLARLANLKADQIKRVEYSNNPGTRYLDRGASGIINIILKEREDGGSLVAQGQSALTTGLVNGYLLGSYHKGKSEFALEYNLGYRNYDQVPYQLEDSYIDPARTVTRSQRTNMPFWYIDHTLNAEYTYQHDDSTMFVASLQDNFLTKTLDATGTMTETDRGVTTEQTMQQHSYQKDNLPKLDLFYTHKMPNDQKLELNVVGEYATDLYDNTLTYTSGTYATHVDGHGYALSGEGVYSKSFGKTTLRTGLQYQHNFAENEYTLYNTTSAMTKDNAYLYAELQGIISSNMSYSVGTGAKLLNVTDGTNSQSYLRNLSTARLNWHPSDCFSLTAIVQYTPMLPTLASLSPVFQQTDDVEGTIGNPNLKPSEQLRDALLLRYNHSSGFYAFSSIGAMRIFHTYFDVYHYDADRDLFILTYQNADLWYVPYAYAEVGVRGLWSHLNLSLDGTYYHYVSKGSEFSHTRNNFTANANAQFYWNNFVAGANFTLLPQWTLNAERYIMSEMAQSLYVQYRYKSLTAMLAWHCPFNKEGYRYETIGLSAVHPYHHTHWTANNGNLVVLGLTWQMDFGRKFHKGEKTLQNGGYDNGMVRGS
jgi:hypothetical protein